ncbi:MAG: bifunctional tRNA (5-methylaminomethyl-2-thiouridine)(34)-methyltransferase MnmD/FAD-dependent 5-carboxymethylaminomethyl-2-thiouridine(34) oxidoreductase MnmC [Alphaproteobacteria bacterium]|nr:bifunctional tRNA (5-methylaminomethyl-2-thiouridine)(34)-methyltransferase MnmD/FAD-dependent 5-carboxymethylaminomethyl-2-thiouridine(34) oxidoreductase MnmC [Alphaproteobacteria bacterium]MDP7221767.1 bifunctional tRNA (5-methylaminomethyl-2-thiouridine)(34)-methyltransferase MnmD/FAD-dependent 5-carboxymethylaminomethyl-2-thiouridine(34) oxidoreductase MnmC [Alphaproteobacteria bacterium]
MEIDKSGILRSSEFDDIYFSVEDGLAESDYVFLQSNDLPARFAHECSRARRFVIAETGFGTGLNFLQTCRRFAAHAPSDAVLHFISFEKYPLPKAMIEQALSQWKEVLEPHFSDLLASYPLRIQGMHRLVLGPQIVLDLIIGDVNDAIAELDVPGGVDAWYLDGFAPSKNPDMWSDTLFDHMTRLSAPSASFATFTAAGFVKRGLQAAGFDVGKKNGYGRKREMLCGRMVTSEQAATATSLHQTRGDQLADNTTRKVAVIGGGLAGTSCAHVLKQYGLTPVLFEKEQALAAGSSGNDIGLYNPRFSAHRSAEADFYSSAFAMTYRTLTAISEQHDIDFKPCGNLHIATDDRKRDRLARTYKNWGWHEDHMQMDDDGGILLLDGGSVSPRKLCNAYANDIECRFGADITELPVRDENGHWVIDGEVFDAVVIASAMHAKTLLGTEHLPIYTVQGQITTVSANAQTRALDQNLCFGGYMSAAQRGYHVIGATFDKSRHDCLTTPEDDQENIARLAEHFPAFADGLEVTGARASLRTTSQDHFPVVGRVPDYTRWENGDEGDVDGLYLSVAHGSHGLVSTIAGAHLVADMICDMPRSLPQGAMAQLDPARFLRRVRKKGKI